MPEWAGPLPDPIDFLDGSSDTYSLLPYITPNFDPAKHKIILESGGPLPPAVTINPVDGLVFTNTGGDDTGQTPSKAVFGLVNNAAYDWELRKAGGTLILAQNFNYANTTELFAAHTFALSPTGNMTLSTEHALSGKSVRFAINPGDGASHGGLMSYLNGVNATVYPRFYLQVIMWQDTWLNWPYKSNDGGDYLSMPKWIIIDRWNATASWGEVVGHMQSGRGFPTMYRLNTDFNQFVKSRTTTSGANIQWQPSIDRGTPANPQSDAEFERRYGPFYNGTNSPAFNIPCDQQNVPDPDASIGGVTWARGNWSVCEFFIDYPNDRVQAWWAHYGQQPVKFVDSIDDDTGVAGINPGRAINGYDGFTLTPYRTDGIGEAGRPASEMFYVEVLIKTTPILFPGGHVPPGNLG